MPNRESGNDRSTGANDTEQQSGRWTIGRVVTLAVVGLVGLVVLLFLVALLLAVADPDRAAALISYFRDLVTIVLTIQGILIITALGILVLQIARFVNLLMSETRPIIDDAQAAAQTAKSTATFVSKNVREPLIRIQAALTGLLTFFKELFRIRRAIRPDKKKQEKDTSDG